MCHASVEFQELELLEWVNNGAMVLDLESVQETMSHIVILEVFQDLLSPPGLAREVGKV